MELLFAHNCNVFNHRREDFEPSLSVKALEEFLLITSESLLLVSML
jgi:hypothetical protein